MESYNKNKDYCSYSPDELFNVKFNYACYLHDRQYGNEVKNRKTRLKADQDFRDRIYKIFIKHKKQRRGFIISRIYYYAVRIMGYKFWI